MEIIANRTREARDMRETESVRWDKIESTQRLKKILTIVVTGANGQLGQCLREIAPSLPHQFIFTDVAELDITSREDVAALMTTERPDWVINCAAYTAVDKAESEPELATLLNATAVEILASEAQKVKAGIVQISTDYVFKGDESTPRTELDTTDPQSVYGSTKLEGERLAAQSNEKHVIIRTSWLYSTYGNNFVKTMQRLGNERNELGVVGDQWGSPTSAHDLALAIIAAVENPTFGIYHYSNEGATSWALFAEEIMKLSGLECSINHITTAEYPTPASRPAYSLMNKEKFALTFGVSVPEWELSLEKVIKKLSK